jgi:beta-lactamase regulating signal transducer with metallopeptidase domain
MTGVLSDILQSPLGGIIADAVLHSLWFFSLIALSVFLIIRYQLVKNSTWRFRITLGALVISFCAFILIIAIAVFKMSGDTTAITNIHEAYGPDISDKIFAQASDGLKNTDNYIFMVWLIGVSLLSVRYLFSWTYLTFISAASNYVINTVLSDIFVKFATKNGVTGNVIVAESRFVSSPVLIGIFKPVILFPVGLVNQLTPQETEAVLAHELAHILRKDFVLNIFISVTEIFFFYHPAIWWLTSLARSEREYCCDERALQWTADRLCLAKTLVKIQGLSQSGNVQLALSFNQSKYFSNRIKRILNMNTRGNYFSGRLLGMSLAMAGLLFFAFHLTGKNYVENKLSDANNESSLTTEIPRDSIPSFNKESITIMKKSDDRDVKISIENGDIKELIVDGKKIAPEDYDQYEDIIAEVKPSQSGRGNSFFFFDDNGGRGSFRFDFRNPGDTDSLFGRFDQDFVFPFGMNKGDHREMMEQFRKQMESMKFDFDFDASENFRWDMKEFGMPEMDEIMKKLEKDGFNFQFGPKSFEFEMDEDVPSREFEWKNNENSVNEILGDALNRDGFLIPGKVNKVELTGKHLKINGEKQPSNIWNKYKSIVEEVYGSPLNKNSKLEFSIMGKEPKRKYRIF